jgi:CRP-like cAMP-binding protein
MGKPSSDALARHVAFLRRVPLFADLKESQLGVVAHDFRLRTYEKDATIFRQDDRGHEMYVILEGKVRIFKLSPAGDETSIQIFTVGDILGELAALDRQPRSASAKAIGRCALLELAGDLFVQRVGEIPELAISLARVLAGKLRWTAEYAEAIGCEQEAGKRYELDLALNQSDLASLVGARREWVNRILQDWQRRGLIEYRAGKLILLDLPRVIQERDSRIEANRPDAQW